MLRFVQGVIDLPMNSMTSKQLILSIAIITLVALALYLLIATRLLLEPSQTELPLHSNIDTAETVKKEVESVATANNGLSPTARVNLKDQNRQGNYRLIEIFGRALDRDAQPIEDVFITDERYFFNTRSDDQGHYRILLDLPRHRYPTLNFLRHGFSGKRVKVTKDQLQQKQLYELDVVLEDNPDSVKLSGWVGNEIGVALEGARVELTALKTVNTENFSLTVFTNSGGNFILEGVPADERYKLSVNLAPKYPVYLDQDFIVGLNPQQLNIELKSLKFVDIDGMMLNREATPVTNFEIYVSNVTTGVHSRKIVSDSSGFFSLKGFPLGEVSLSTRGSDIYEITGLVLTDNEYRNLVLRIDKGNHYLSGRIRDKNGIVPKKAMVTLDKTFQEGPVKYHQYRSQATVNDGEFSFKELGTGEYLVTVYAPGYQKHELVHRLSNQSDEIQVTLRRTEN